MSLKNCSDMTEAIAFDPNFGLFLKPISKLKINIQLPKLCLPGQSISSWQVMEKLKEIIKPDTFLFLKTLKITTNVIKLEGEFETKSSCDRALARLKAAICIKLSGFADKLQIRAAQATDLGPTRHDWEAFFRDAKGGNEMKPGERPDTIHLEEMPIRWFSESGKSSVVSERILRKVFETFGKIRRLEILQSLPSTSSFSKTGSLNCDLLFEAYIQYEEYVEFSIAMDSLRGKKLLYKDPNGKIFSAYIKVDFDKNKYLSERAIKKRKHEENKVSLELKKKESHSKDEKKCTIPELNKTDSSKVVPKSAKDIKCSSTSKEELKDIPKQPQPCSSLSGDPSKEAKLLLRELLLRAENRIQKSISALNKQKAPANYSDSQYQADVFKKNFKESDQHEKKKGTEKSVSNSRTTEKSKSHDKKSSSSNKRKLSKERDHSKKFENNYSKDDGKKYRKNDDKSPKRHKKESSYDKYEKRNSTKHLGNERKRSSKNEKIAEPRKLKKEKRASKEKRVYIVEDDADEQRNKERLILQERILKEKLIRNLRAKKIEKMKCADVETELSDQRMLSSVLSLGADPRS